MGIELESSEITTNAADDPRHQLIKEIEEGEKVVVDAFLWHKLCYKIMTNPRGFASETPHGLMMLLGRVRGGESSQECQAFWEESKCVVNDHQNKGG